jgi:uncharacterized membrane protein YiaA
MNPTRTVLKAVGVILFLGASFKFAFGVYVSEAPLYLAILFAGAVCVYASEKMKKRDEDDEPDDGNNNIVG